MSQKLTAELDHVVISVKENLDDARDTYTALGFHLQPRGHHSHGSSNHLAAFGETYLELLGFEPGKENLRADLWAAPTGLTGLVFKTQDSLQVHETLKKLGIDGDPPSEFHRPVTLPDGSEQPAKFRTVRLASDLIPNGRAFFCHQFTPENVWIEGWRSHPNQVIDIAEFVIATVDPAATAAPFDRLFPDGQVQAQTDGSVTLRAGVASVRFIALEKAREAYPGVSIAPDDTLRMVALVLQTRSLQAVRDVLAKAGITPQEDTAQTVVVLAADAHGVTLQFVEASA